MPKRSSKIENEVQQLGRSVLDAIVPDAESSAKKKRTQAERLKPGILRQAIVPGPRGKNIGPNLRAELAKEYANQPPRDLNRPHLISRDELLAAGALDVPPGWRKSLSAGQPERDLFSDLKDDDEDETSELNDADE